MKILIKVLNVLGTILASLVTPILIAVMVVTPLVDLAVSLFQGDRLAELVSDIDVVEILRRDEDYEEFPAQLGMKTETFEEILRSDICQDLVEFVIEDTMEVVTGEKEKSEMSAGKLKKIFGNNMSDVANIIRRTDPASKNKTDKEIEDEIFGHIDNNFDKIYELIPSADSIAEELEENVDIGIDIRSALSMVRNDLLPMVIGILVILSLAILVGKFYRFKGFLWLGIVYLFVAVMSYVVSSSLPSILSSAIPEASDAMGFVERFMLGAVNKYAVAYGMIGAALVVVYIILRLTVVGAKKTEKAPIKEEKVSINFKPQPEGPEFETVSMGAARPDNYQGPATGTPYTSYQNNQLYGTPYNAQQYGTPYSAQQYGTPYNAQQYGTPYNAQPCGTPAAPAAPEAEAAAAETSPEAEAVKAPLQGRIVEVFVSEGDSVQNGEKILILEAMKMENEIIAPRDGVIQSIAVCGGDEVAAGDVLYKLI